MGPIALTVAVPVVFAAGYFALWACATAPASLRSPAPLPAGQTAEFGLGGVVGQHARRNSDFADTTPPIGGGGQLWLTSRGRRFEIGGNLPLGSFGIIPNATLRIWALNAQRFRLGVGGELGLGGGAAEIPVGVGLGESLWLYTAPRIRSQPGAIVIPGGLSYVLGRNANLLVEGGGMVYRFGAESTLDNLALRYYGAAGIAFPF